MVNLRFVLQRNLLIPMVFLVILFSNNFSEGKATQKQTELIIAAASSLTDVMNELGAKFIQENPGARLLFNFGATGTLQTQIEQGAPVDIFAGASKLNLEILTKQGLLDELSKKALCLNTLALLVRREIPTKESNSFHLLISPEIKKVAIGDPAYVPAGKYAMELSEKLNLTEQIKPRLILASNVRQALVWVDTGEVDAAIVYGTDAAFAQKAKTITKTEKGLIDIRYEIAITKKGVSNKYALAFLKWVTNKEGLSIFQKYGFIPGE